MLWDWSCNESKTSRRGFAEKTGWVGTLSLASFIYEYVHDHEGLFNNDVPGRWGQIFDGKTWRWRYRAVWGAASVKSMGTQVNRHIINYTKTDHLHSCPRRVPFTCLECAHTWGNQVHNTSNFETRFFKWCRLCTFLTLGRALSFTNEFGFSPSSFTTNPPALYKPYSRVLWTQFAPISRKSVLYARRCVVRRQIKVRWKVLTLAHLTVRQTSKSNNLEPI